MSHARLLYSSCSNGQYPRVHYQCNHQTALHCPEKAHYVAQKLKSFCSITALREEKRKLPHVWLQLCFQMCQGSGVKDKSTRMWCTLTRNQFAVCAFLTGGGRWAECLAFLLSTTPSERPHFVVVNYDTATSCSLLRQCLPMAPRRNVSHVKHSGWKPRRVVVFGLSWTRGHEIRWWSSPQEAPLKSSISFQTKWNLSSFSTRSLIRNFKEETEVQYVAGQGESGVLDWLVALTKDRPFHPLPGAEQQ